MSDPATITRLLELHREGDPEALDQVVERVYPVLRRLAGSRLRRSPGTIGVTGLVNEAYIKLVDSAASWERREHFYAVAASAMRQILIDHARARQSLKRGGGLLLESLDPEVTGWEPATVDLLALDKALERLQVTAPRLAQVVELRFYGGLSSEETARVMRVSARTVRRDWRKARALLQLDLGGSQDQSGGGATSSEEGTSED